MDLLVIIKILQFSNEQIQMLKGGENNDMMLLFYGIINCFSNFIV